MLKNQSILISWRNLFKVVLTIFYYGEKILINLIFIGGRKVGSHPTFYSSREVGGFLRNIYYGNNRCGIRCARNIPPKWETGLKELLYWPIVLGGGTLGFERKSPDKVIKYYYFIQQVQQTYLGKAIPIFFFVKINSTFYKTDLRRNETWLNVKEINC